MTCFIISYEAATKESNKIIIKTIQNYKINNQIFENTWAVVTDDEATDIRDALKQVISPEEARPQKGPFTWVIIEGKTPK